MGDFFRDKMEEILFEPEVIAARVAELGARLNGDFGDKNPLMICVLRGAAPFFTDLCRCMDCNMEMDFIAVSSYGHGTSSTGAVRMVKDVNVDVTGRHVIIVEDIIDTGLTLRYLKKLFCARNAASVTTVAFLDKKERRTVEMEADYVGYEIPNKFVVGYGLDYEDYYRNLPYVGVLRP